MPLTPATDSLRADHRQIEDHLDRLLDPLLHLTPARVDEVRRSFHHIRRLADPHFEKEETVFYPRLRSRLPALLARMDEQHAHTRELERHLEEVLESMDDPPTPRQLDELHRFGIEYHDAVQVHIVDEEEQLLRLADAELPEHEQLALVRLWTPAHPRL